MSVLLDKRANGVAVVTLNRPEVLNALDVPAKERLGDIWREIAEDPAVRVAVLTGAGEKAFCAGGDLKDRNGMTDAQWQHQHAVFEQAVTTMLDVPPPIIAAVNGVAYGGGCEFILLADFAYGATHARLALTEVTLGIMPGACATQMLPRAVES